MRRQLPARDLGKAGGRWRLRYCYYNCRSARRIGKELYPGFRIPTAVLDKAVLEQIADITCTPERVRDLVVALTENRSPESPPDHGCVASLWRSLIVHDPQVSRAYARHLIDRITVYENRVMLVGRASTAEAGQKGRDLAGL